MSAPAGFPVGTTTVGPGECPAPIPVYSAGGPLEQTPFLANRGASRCVKFNAQEVTEVLDTKAKCALIGQMLAVCFGVECAIGCRPAPEGLVAPSLTLVRAYLTWSLGTVDFRAALDVRNGMIINVPADNVRVSAFALAGFPEGTFEDQAWAPPVNLSVGVGYGAGNVREAARFTEVVSVAAGATQTIQIPPFASGFALVPAGTSTLTAYVDTGGAGPFPTYTAMSPADTEAGFPLVNAARCLVIDNSAGLTAVSGFVIFALDL